MVLMALLACLLLVTSAMAKEFDWAVANTSIWLSTATYCPTEIYRNRTFIGYSAGFVLTDSIISEQYDVQGFVGHMPSQKAIYVAYRGSSSIPNWLDNINTFSKDYKLCAGCTVHTGFYQAEQIVIDSVEAMVRRQLTAHPNYRLIVTGHSLGAALATFTVLDLLSRNLTAQLMTFGSPRVGNRLFAEYASKVIADSSRVTHYKDIVPHLPWSERFQHISGTCSPSTLIPCHCLTLTDPSLQGSGTRTRPA